MSKIWTYSWQLCFLKKTPAVLSLGKLCEDHGSSYHWTSGQKPHLTKKGKRIDCNISNCVPFVVPGLSASSSTTPTQERSGSSFGETRCINQQKPKTKLKMKDAKKYKVIYFMTCRIGCWSSKRIWSMNVVFQSHGETLSLDIEDTSSSSHELPMESRAKAEPGSGEHSVYTHFPKDPNCDICLKTKNNEGVLQKTCWYSRAQSGKLWWLDNCRSPNSQWRKWILTIIDMPWWYEIWQLCGYIPTRVKLKRSQETQKRLMKFLEPTRKPKVIYTDNSLEFGTSCEDLSWNHCTSMPHRSETNGIAERAVCRVKEGTSDCIVAIGSKWKLVGRFYGMLHLSAKRHRFIFWWEDALWKTLWATT